MKKTLLIGCLALFCGASAFADKAKWETEYSDLLAWNKTDLLQWLKGLSYSPAILLDVTSKAGFIETGKTHFIVINIVFGIDKGYGYSVGPFDGLLYLIPVGNGQVKWFKITDDYGHTYINGYYRQMIEQQIERMSN